jgi:hypothetical protein
MNGHHTEENKHGQIWSYFSNCCNWHLNTTTSHPHHNTWRSGCLGFNFIPTKAFSSWVMAWNWPLFRWLHSFNMYSKHTEFRQYPCLVHWFIVQLTREWFVVYLWGHLGTNACQVINNEWSQRMKNWCSIVCNSKRICYVSLWFLLQWWPLNGEHHVMVEFGEWWLHWRL